MLSEIAVLAIWRRRNKSYLVYTDNVRNNVIILLALFRTLFFPFIPNPCSIVPNKVLAIPNAILHSVVQLFYGIRLVELSEAMQTLLIPVGNQKPKTTAEYSAITLLGYTASLAALPVQNKKRAILFVWTTVSRLKESSSCYQH